ncbi:hypothetical protein P280DRAFT_168954 [Massarina eburnea CBS 473.64]|uniref:Uncharacterized protein n=1 Tax=Massarina eburnea CBS 473.64 TaxID=1395130 RepID=A0A6A6RKR7_9PLEO|nr:hypothetical protein P280DRAFT_168954 [Massarina eburnea CBS 473.64]
MRPWKWRNDVTPKAVPTPIPLTQTHHKHYPSPAPKSNYPQIRNPSSLAIDPHLSLPRKPSSQEYPHRPCHQYHYTTARPARTATSP